MFTGLMLPIDKGPSRQRWLYGVLGLLMLAGFLLRVPAINYTLALDEDGVFESCIRKGFSGIFLTFYTCGNHPLSSFFSWISYCVFGDYDWALRLPSMVFGLATIPLSYAVAAKLFSRKSTGLLAACLFTFSPYHIAYSASSREYVLVIFFAMTATLCLMSNLARVSWRASLGFLASVFLMGLSQVGSMALVIGWSVILAVYAAGILLQAENRRGRLISLVATAASLGAGCVLMAIAYLPACNFFTGVASRLFRGQWTPAAQVFLCGAEQQQWYPFDRYTMAVTSMQGGFFWATAAVALLGLMKGLRDRKAGAGVCLAMLASPLAVILAIDLKLEPRYMLELLPFFLVALSAGMMLCAETIGGGITAALDFSPYLRPVFNLVGLVVMVSFVAAGLAPVYEEFFPWHVARLACVGCDFKAVIRAALPEIGPEDLVTYDVGASWPVRRYVCNWIRPKLAARIEPARHCRLWYITQDGGPRCFPFDFHAETFARETFARMDVAEVDAPGLWSPPMLPARFDEGLGLTERFKPWLPDNLVPDEQARLVQDPANPSSSQLEVTELDGNLAWSMMTPAIEIPRGKLLIYRALIKEEPEGAHGQLFADYIERATGNRQEQWEDVPRGQPIMINGEEWKQVEIVLLPPAQSDVMCVGLRVVPSGCPGSKITFRGVALWTDADKGSLKF